MASMIWGETLEGTRTFKRTKSQRHWLALSCFGLLLATVFAAVLAGVCFYPPVGVHENETLLTRQEITVWSTSYENTTGSVRFGEAGGVRHFLYGELPTLAPRMVTEPNGSQASYVKQSCGMPSAHVMDDTVALGEYLPFEPQDFPWLVRVVVVMEGSGADVLDSANASKPRQALGICGGTLIALGWAITARHCFSERRTYKSVLYHPSTGSFVEYKQLYAYPAYNDIYNQNDFMLVQLKTPLTGGSPSNVVCLPNADVIPRSGRHCVIPGWQGGEIGATPPQQLWVTVEHPTRCQSRYCGLKYDVNANICDKETTSARSSDEKCHGLSGSPLLCLENGRWVVYGILDWSGPRCDVSKGHGFALTSTRLRWICCFVPHADLPVCADVRCRA